MNMRLLSAVAGALLATGAAVHAEEAGSWVVKAGVHSVDPTSNNGSLADGAMKADAGSDTEPTITGEYFVTPNFGVELLASLPWEHEIRLNGAKAATVKQLPPTLSAQWHFNPGGTVSPFVGAGLNYTIFYNERTTGPLAGANLNVSNTLGPALHGGVDFRLDERWLVTVDARWIKIGPDVKVNGAKVGSIDIDPIVYGVAVGYRF